MGHCVTAVVVDASGPESVSGPVWVWGTCAGLLELFAGVSDGRSDQGRVHPVAVVLTLAAAAVVAGMKGYTAIAGWVKDLPAPLLARLYARADADPVGPPSKATIWRVVTDAEVEVFDTAVSTWLVSGLLGDTDRPESDTGTGADPAERVELMPVRLDGKTVRGAKDAEGNQPHLLGALLGHTAGSSVIAAQTEVGAKTNEVPMARDVLGQIDLSERLVTADALHTVKATAEFIHQRGGQFILPGQAEPPSPLRRPRRAALAGNTDRAHSHRPRPQPGHHPHHPGPPPHPPTYRSPTSTRCS